MEPKTKSDDAQSQGAPEAAEPRKPLSLLAREAFGADFHGEVKEAEETPKPPEEEAGEEETTQTDTEVPDGTPDDDQTQVDAKSDEGTPIESVQELLEHLDADPAWFSGLKVDVKVNDKTSQVPLQELVTQYQTNQAADERLEQAKAKSQAMQQEYEQRRSELEQQFIVAAKLLELNEQQLTKEFTSIDWAKLQAEDPAMWAAQRQAFGERNGQIQQLKQAIAVQYQDARGRQKVEEDKQRAASQQEQTQQLLAAMPKVDPEWADPAKLDTKRRALWDYLIKQGFAPEDIGATADHRAFLIAQKAMLWDQSQGKVELTKKRIRAVPKVIKPGAKREPQVINMEKVKKAQQHLRSTGKPADALALMRLTRKG